MARTRRSHRINPQAHSQRTALRLLGGILVAVGGIFTLVGLTSFFSSFGSFEPPDKFWCVFVGLPMLGFGVMLLKLGYMGTIARYVAGEAAPVATDTLNFVADDARPGITKVASAIATGIRKTSQDCNQPMQVVACSSCGHDNDPDARFCDQCGNAMDTPQTCPNCAKVYSADQRFCSDCGTDLR